MGTPPASLFTRLLVIEDAFRIDAHSGTLAPHRVLSIAARAVE